MCIYNLETERIQKLLEFCKKYSLEFSNLNLLNQAFVHTSYTQENAIDILSSYERLEFLGDAVLKLAISDILYKNFPLYQEGKMTNIRAQLVSDKNIFEFSKKLGFEELIVLGKNEKKHGGAKKESILACAFEALLGAIYIEYKEKGYNRALNFLIDNFMDEILETEKKSIFYNPKSILQEYTQDLNHKLPEYITVNETGAQHDKTFYVEVVFENKIIGKGSAKTIKQAQQEAAYDAIQNLNIKVKG